MGLAILNKLFVSRLTERNMRTETQQSLTHAEVNRSYTIKGINAKEEGMKDFLFTLGCFEGEQVTVISVLADNYIIHVKDARYSIDSDLAKAILV